MYILERVIGKFRHEIMSLTISADIYRNKLCYKNVREKKNALQFEPYSAIIRFFKFPSG